MRYVTNGLPHDANAAAFMPHMTRTPKYTTYGPVNRALRGHPGDKAIHSAKPAAIPNGPLNRMAQGSFRSPDMFFPSLYYVHIRKQSIAGVRYTSTNELPVPATSYNAVPQIAYRPRRVAGAKQVGWPPAVPIWQSVNSTPTGG